MAVDKVLVVVFNSWS